MGAATGASSCQVEHVGLVLSGEAVAKMDDGREVVMRAGDFFYIPPGHDSWVVGKEPYVSLHIMGSEGRDLGEAGLGLPARALFALRLLRFLRWQARERRSCHQPRGDRRDRPPPAAQRGGSWCRRSSP